MTNFGLLLAALGCALIFQWMLRTDWRLGVTFAFGMILWSLWLIEFAIRGVK